MQEKHRKKTRRTKPAKKEQKAEHRFRGQDRYKNEYGITD